MVLRWSYAAVTVQGQASGDAPFVVSLSELKVGEVLEEVEEEIRR